jgi:hypothetical protein
MTSMATNGLPETRGFPDLVEDSPEGMAQAVVGLLRESRQRARLGRKAYAAARSRSWEAVGNSVHSLLVDALRSLEA